MTVVQHKDKSEEWLAWRNTGLGSSDAPIIAGVSEWATPFQLWEMKTGLVTRDQSTSFIQDKGNQAEVFARAQHELITGLNLQPALGQHQDMPFLLASADGFDIEQRKGGEYKLASKADHEGVRNGICPQKYFPQVQHLMLVFGLKEWDYCSYYVEKGKPLEAGELLVLTVPADIDWMVNYVNLATDFWNKVQNKIPPELTDADVRTITQKETVALAKEFVEKSQALAKLSDEVETLKAKLKKEADGFSKVTFGSSGVTYSKSWRKGNVDYSSVPELLGVDLEPYRGKGSFTVSVAPPREKKTSKKDA